MLHNLTQEGGFSVSMSYTIRILELAVIGLALLGFSWAVEAEVYRSVDAQGRTVFTDRPSPGGALTPPAATGKLDPAGGRSPTSDWAERERAFRARNLERSAAETAEKEEQARRCAQARSRDSRLAQSDGSVLYREGQGGAREFISDQERNELAERARQDIERYCRR